MPKNMGIPLLMLFIIIVIIVSFGNWPLRQDAPIRKRRQEQVQQRADSLFSLLEFQGKVKYTAQVQCGGAKAFCKKIFFVRTDTSTQVGLVDYGFVQLMKPDSNILLTGTRLWVRIDNSPPKGISMPIQEGDRITNSKGEKYFIVYNMNQGLR